MQKILPDYRGSFTRNYQHEYIGIKRSGIIEEGDLILCRSLDFSFVESPLGQMVRVYPNSTLFSVLAARESTGYTVGEAPRTKLPTDRKFQQLTESGVTGICTSYRKAQKKPADLKILGRVVDDKENKIDMKSLAILEPSESIYSEAPSIFVVGSSTDAGKTMTVDYLVNYFKKKKMKIGCIKVTGTMSVRENLEYLHAGTDFVLDAVDAGWATTYTKQSTEILRAAKGLINEASKKDPDLIFVELGGDIIGANSEAILNDLEIRKYIGCLLLAAKDSFAALGVTHSLEKLNLRPMAISGVVAVNELTCKRCTRLTGIQTVDIERDYEKIGDEIIKDLFG